MGLRQLRRSGMTLIEILIVVGILTALMGVLATKVFSTRDTANVKVTKMAMDKLKQSLDMFKLSVNRYPTSSEGLGALVKNPGGIKGWSGPYADKKNLIDAWQTPFEYQLEGKRNFTIVSGGADGEIGTDDDLTYPEPEGEAEEKE